jgi:hypothetical protein
MWGERAECGAENIFQRRSTAAAALNPINTNEKER